MSLLSLIARFAWRHRRAYASAGAMLVGIAVLTVWVPRRVGEIIDGLVAGRRAGSTLWTELAILLAMGVVIYLLRVGWRMQLFSAAFRLGVELRTQLYHRLSLQGPPYFHRQRTGDLMANATNDVDAVEMAAGEAFLAAFDGTLTLVLVVAMMTLGVDWRLGLVALLPFPFMACAFYFISQHVHEAWRRSLDRFSDVNDQVQETVAAVRTLRALGLEDRAGRDFAQRAQAAADAGFDAQRWESAYEPAVGLTLTAATVLTLAVGGWLVWQGELSIGMLTAFTMYLGQLIWPMFAAGWVFSLIERGKAAWSRLDPVLRAPLSMADGGTHTGAPTGTLRFDGVTFRYPAIDGQAAAPAVAGVSFELVPGRTLGIVGPTGAGKSTLVHLLLRHYAPQEGTIAWGGTPLPQFRLAALRNALAWVPQEPFLFSATIADNVALARADAMLEDIERAAVMADLHGDVLRLAHGYHTRVGERGVTLSGGQRQRVAIARALLSDAPLLLLDDALSAVDTATEARILAHLRAARVSAKGRSRARTSTEARSAEDSSLSAKGRSRARTGTEARSAEDSSVRTTIIVSHRLSAVADADEIIVLKQGRVAERGDHEALLRAQGWYAAQWRYQQLEASLEKG